MIYLASPYSNPDPLVVKTRFFLAEQVTAILMREGLFIYSPIVHCHALAERWSMPTDFDYWKNYNIDFIRRSDKFLILTIPGWEESKGVQGELKFARSAGIKIGHVNDVGEIRWQE